MHPKNPVLSEYFDRLKELVPEIYAQPRHNQQDAESAKLYTLLKKTLGIIEAVYLQNKDKFHQARVAEYGKIIQELKTLGYEYRGNEELLNKATNQLIMAAKKPMQKAKGAKKTKEDERKAM